MRSTPVELEPVIRPARCHDTQHNGVQHNNEKCDTQPHDVQLLCRVSFMLSVAIKSFKLSVIMLIAIMLNVIMLSVILLNVVGPTIAYRSAGRRVCFSGESTKCLSTK